MSEHELLRKLKGYGPYMWSTPMQPIRRGSGDGGHPRSKPGGGPLFPAVGDFHSEGGRMATVEVSGDTAEDPIAADFHNDWCCTFATPVYLAAASHTMLRARRTRTRCAF